MSLSGNVIVLAEDEGFVLGAYRSVFINIWRGVATMERLRRTLRESEGLARKFPDGYGTLAILGAAHVAMPPEVRAFAEQLSRNPPASLKAIAHVIEGSGFGAAATRSLAAGMMLLNRAGSPIKIFDRPEAAAIWLMPRLGIDDRAAASGLADAVVELRAARPEVSASARRG
jgi:hypothetical protein